MPPADVNTAGAAAAPATSTRARPKVLLALAALFLAVRLATGVHEATSPARPGGLVQWVAPADAVAAGAGRPVLYDFSAGWCEPCKRMEREVFSDAGSASFINATFLSVRVADEDRIGSRHRLAATARRHGATDDGGRASRVEGAPADGGLPGEAADDGVLEGGGGGTGSLGPTLAAAGASGSPAARCRRPAGRRACRTAACRRRPARWESRSGPCRRPPSPARPRSIL